MLVAGSWQPQQKKLIQTTSTMPITFARRIFLFPLLILTLPLASAEAFSPSSSHNIHPAIKSRSIKKLQILAAKHQNPLPAASAEAFVSTTSSEDFIDSNIMAVHKKKINEYAWTKPTLELAIPALVASIADPLLSMYDTANIGRLGSNSLAALGVCTSIFYMSFYGFLATKTATTTLVASASTDKEASLVTTTSLQLGIAAGFLVMIGLRFFGPHALAGMGVDASSDMYPHALTYLSTRCLSAPFFLLITVAEGALRGYGDTKIPLLASAATAATMVALEPFLMFILGWKIRGAATAMGISQVAGATVYAYFLKRRFAQIKSKGETSKTSNSSTTDDSILTKGEILLAIAKANLSMIIKQGSLLATWAYATKSATKLGAKHVAAHQVALSFWMVFAYILDAVSVAAQVLFSKAQKSFEERRSITKYMLSVATAQGLLITLIIAGLSSYVPAFFTKDEAVIALLKTLMPVLSIQQVLISLTFVMEALAAGGSQFSLLGIGTALSALTAVILMRSAESVLELWTGGILAMFVGRLTAATVGVLNANSMLPKLRINKARTGKNA